MSVPAAETLPTPPAAHHADIKGAPVFFMHIAKTAGSYLNTVLTEALGQNRVATHVEHRLGGAADLTAMLAEKRQIISGHVMNGLWNEIAAGVAQDFRKVTIVREPIAHLASHLLWLDHYNQPEHRADYLLLDEAHQRVVDRIGTIDVTDIGHLDHYLTHLNPTETRLFDNCQSRYFLAAGRRDPGLTRALSLADVRRLRPALETFDLILSQDDLSAGLAKLGALLGVALAPLSGRINEGRAVRRIDTTAPLVRQVLSRRTLVDQWLWRQVQGAGQ